MKMSKYSWVIFLVLILFVANNQISYGDNDSADSSNANTEENILSIDSMAFDEWINNNCSRAKISISSLDTINSLLLKRLEAGLAVSPDSVMLVVNAWHTFESPDHASELPAKKQQFDHTLALLDKLLGLPRLLFVPSADLLHLRASILRELGRDEEAAKAFSQADVRYKIERNALELKRMRNIVELGDMHLLSNHTVQAEKVYLEALSCPWYLISDPDIQMDLKTLYIRAGDGLISCRAGDLSALEDIHFVPSTMDILRPNLERAIKAANKN